MRSISIFGTSSDAGKSLISAFLGKALQNLGFSVAPFKAQNVSNNAKVCKDGSEIGIAQYFQAEVLGITPSYHLNPILLKSGSNRKSSLILNGKAVKELSFKEYFKYLDFLKPEVKKAYNFLNNRYDIVICEGAGSPVELNLLHKDLSNTFTAKEFDTRIILVADIERGGVFASIWGVYNLLEEDLRKNVTGVIINKFRGDISFFQNGIKIIEEEFKIPVLGIIPHIPFNLSFEDSQSLQNYSQQKEPKIKVGIVLFDHISNFTDFEPLIADKEIDVEFCLGSFELYDLIILPGSKLTVEDLANLKKKALFGKLKKREGEIFGICGGFEMMFETLRDEECVENSCPVLEKGLGFVDDEIIFQKKKITANKTYDLFNHRIEGYEIHNGISKKYPLFYDKGQIKGTFVHGVFDDNDFRTSFFKNICKEYQGYDFKAYKKRKFEEFTKVIEENIDLDKIVKCL